MHSNFSFFTVRLFDLGVESRALLDAVRRLPVRTSSCLLRSARVRNASSADSSFYIFKILRS